ncbi:hypothetical protein ACIPV2_01810 [Microbacterium sp. NPDC089987]|uniref:hypothetical protein n=1 Tax=Microbacterium sp. NPDC089987 TaxID=3364202 RepID=UPI0037FA2163
MSLPIAVTPSPARGISSAPRADGGSAEDFAAAVREAEAPTDFSTAGAAAGTQLSVAQRGDKGSDRGEDQTAAAQLVIGGLLGSTDAGAANAPIDIAPAETAADLPSGAGGTAAPDAQFFEQSPLTPTSPQSASPQSASPEEAVDAVAAAMGSERSLRADAEIGASGPAQAPGHAARVAAAADRDASAGAAGSALGQGQTAGQVPMASQGSGAATGSGPQAPAVPGQAGQGQAGQVTGADVIAGAPAATGTQSSPLSTGAAEMPQSSGAKALSPAQLTDLHGAARTRPSITGLQSAPGAPGAAESAAIPSAPTGASAPLAATAAEATSAAGSARPALLPQLAGPVIALARSPQGQHSITLTVSPENVGPVTVRAHIVGSSIRLELHSPSDAGRDALRVILADLRRDLSVAAPGASVDVSARDTSSGSSPDAQARPDSGRSETQARGDAQARGDQQRPHFGAAEARQASVPASVGHTHAPTDPSSSQSRIDVYA